MKVRLEIDDSLNEDEIVIRTKEYTEELKQLQKAKIYILG